MSGAAGSPAGAGLEALLGMAMEIHQGAAGQQEYEAIWPVLEHARRFGREAFEAAVALLGSGDASQRAVGCDLLGTLCDADDDVIEPEVAEVLIHLAESEQNTDVLWSIARTLGLARAPGGVGTLVRLARHPDGDVRFQVAVALPSCEKGADPGLLAQALISLMDDADEQVRDWATFGLGSQTELDGPDVRDALLRGLGDEFLDARDEALVGLARRRDWRVLPVVADRLEEGEVGRLAVEAAAYLGDERLLAPLCALGDWWDLDPELLHQAVGCCDPDQQIRDVAEQAAILEEIEAALAERTGVAYSMSCRRLGRGASLDVTGQDGQTASYDVKALIGNRAGGNLHAAAEAVLSDLRQA